MKHLLLDTARVALITASLAAPFTVLAQTQPAPEQQAVAQTAEAGSAAAIDEGGAAQGEIIVTANKRAENVQRVPLAVQVLSGNQLAAQSVRAFDDLTRVAPSLVVRPAEQPQNSSVSIRGVGTYAFGIGVEPSVAVVVDDVPISIQARAFSDLSDIERIEVLRGPQSTLYGKSASAGLINIVTRAPSKELTVDAHVIATTDSEFGGGASISGPISPDAGYRITGSYTDFAGNVRNLANGTDVNGRTVFTMRGKLVWNSPAGVDVTLSGNYEDGSTTVGRPFIALAPGALLRGNAAQPISEVLPGVTASPSNTNVSLNFLPVNKYYGAGESLKIGYTLPGGQSLLSITSNDYYKLKDNLDQDDTSSTVYDNRQVGQFVAKQVTQEVRLLAPNADKFRYTLGIFYADNDLARNFFRGPLFSLANWRARSKSEQLAAFGQVDWDILEHTTITGGGRFQRETIHYSFIDIQNGNATFLGGARDDSWTYKAGVKQQLTSDVSVYGSYTTGHKGETYDLSTGFNANRAAAGPIRPEKSVSVEAGFRGQFFDRRLTFNATVFTTTYNDFQAQGIEFLADGTQNFRLTNVGKVRTRGVEVEVSARVMDDLSLSGSATYDDAKIRSFPGAQCYAGQTVAQGCTGTPARQNLAGFRPAQAPLWKATATFDYSPDIAGLPVRPVVQGNYVYQSAVNYSINQDPQTLQGAFGIANFSVGFRTAKKQFEVFAFINNAFDKHYAANLFNSLGNFNNQQATQSLVPRDFSRYGGIRASYSY